MIISTTINVVIKYHVRRGTYRLPKERKSRLPLILLIWSPHSVNLTPTLDMAMTGNIDICPESGPKIQNQIVENAAMTMSKYLMALLKRNFVDLTCQDHSLAQRTQ